jgi:hypothetical protein
MAEWERSTLSVPGSRAAVWPETGHYLHEERVAETVALVRGWVQRESLVEK